MFQFSKHLESNDLVTLRKFSRAFMIFTGVYAVLVGGLGIIGWFANIPRLTDWTNDSISMFVNTCILAVCGGAALLALASTIGLAKRIATVLGIFLMLAGSALVFQHLTGIDLGIDTFFINEPWANRAATAPGRPGPPASVAFTLVGLALVLASVARARFARQAVSAIGLMVAALALLSLVGYAFDADPLFALAQYTGIALQTATVIFVLGLGLVASVPDQEPLRTLLKGTTTGLFARRALPAIVLAPILLIVLCYQGVALEYFDVGMGLALLVLGLIVVSSALLWWSVASVTDYEASVFLGANRLRQLVSLMPAAVYTTDHEGLISYYNQRAAELWGREPKLGEEKYTGSFRIWRPDGTPLPEEESPIVAALKHGSSARNQEAVVERPDGTGIVISANVDPLYDADGVCVGAINVFRDITSDKQDEKRQLETERQLFELVEGLPAAIYTTDAEGRVTMYNDAVVEFSGSTPTIGSDDWCMSWKLFSPDGAPLPYADSPMAVALREGRAIRDSEAIAQKPDGARVNFIPYPTPMHDAKGNIIGAVNMLVDITERKQFEKRIEDTNNALMDLTAHLEHRVQERTRQLEEQSEQLRRLALQLAEAEEMERKRIAQILHDHLQQLLIAAKMQLQLVDTKLPSNDSVRRSQECIQQAYDASRSLTSELRPPVLYEGGLIPALQFLARKFQNDYGLDVRLTLAPDADPVSDVLKAIFYQSTQELLMNAMKHAGARECYLTLERMPNHDVRIIVEDHGVGFDADNVGRKGYDGFGLFSIRERIHALGGVCNIESSPGQGTRIELSIPDERKPAFAQDATKGPAEVRSRRKERDGMLTVLLADDHKIVRQSLATLLGTQPFIGDVLESGNGREAIELANETHPDIVLMDLNMPIMNGIEATKALRERNPDIKVIGLSVQAEPETAQAMKDAGAIMYLSKSEDTRILLDVLRELACA